MRNNKIYLASIQGRALLKDMIPRKINDSLKYL